MSALKREKISSVRMCKEEHPEVDGYVILDDCYGDDYSGSEELRNRLVFVDALKGLQEKDVEAATELLLN